MMKVASNSNPSETSGLDGGISNRLLSEAESCSLAGITLDTLRSYTQFSLLKPVIRNQKPFYRYSELTQLFNIDKEETSTAEPVVEENVPTLEKLLNPELEEKLENNIAEKSEVISNKVASETQDNNLPAVRVEDIIIQNQALNSRLKSLEDERDWLRRRVEQLEERSAREQMLMLKEKETLREVINATLVKDKKPVSFSFTDYIKRIALPFFGTPEK